MQRETLSVSGMSCTGCEQNVESALQHLDGVTRVDADHGDDTVKVVVDDDVSEADLQAAVKDAGYEVVA